MDEFSMTGADATVDIGGQPELRPEKPVWGGWATAGFGLLILVVTIVIEGIIGVVIFIGGMASSDLVLDDFDSFMELFEEYAGIITSVSTIIGAAVGIAMILLIIKVKKGLGFWEYLGFRRVTPRAMLLGLLAFGGYFVASLLFTEYLGYSESTDGIDLFATDKWPVLVWIAVCIIAPVFEEMWIRGFLFQGFLRSKLGLSGTMIITSFFWAVMHIQYNIAAMLMIFIFGMLLAYWRYKTKSIWIPIILHAINNTVSLILLTTGV